VVNGIASLSTLIALVLMNESTSTVPHGVAPRKCMIASSIAQRSRTPLPKLHTKYRTSCSMRSVSISGLGHGWVSVTKVRPIPLNHSHTP
jgi:hypothetical protein